MDVDPDVLLEATGRLLTATEWRQRLVEKMSPESAGHYQLRRSFQFEIPPALMDEDSPLVARFLFPWRFVLVLLNVSLWVWVLWRLAVADDPLEAVSTARMTNG